MSGKRRENDAEHSWHIAVMAMLFWYHVACLFFDYVGQHDPWRYE